MKFFIHALLLRQLQIK